MFDGDESVKSFLIKRVFKKYQQQTLKKMVLSHLKVGLFLRLI